MYILCPTAKQQMDKGAADLNLPFYLGHELIGIGKLILTFAQPPDYSSIGYLANCALHSLALGMLRIHVTDPAAQPKEFKDKSKDVRGRGALPEGKLRGLEWDTGIMKENKWREKEDVGGLVYYQGTDQRYSTGILLLQPLGTKRRNPSQFYCGYDGLG
ncbi:hypothetical protein P154DRAFT_607316 [Amniculicola lignicola CBS 123094]|uniref:Uncharacterized protein n=1 Tax=Amniculicola lignicola CBS 123094 TaxID=1392246 RepID=A0A6A5W4Y1_9PLEO|nr:hypothetical protein P154DRAFT_607316 [Amniculicola lignicola CBS 123094]